MRLFSIEQSEAVCLSNVNEELSGQRNGRAGRLSIDVIDVIDMPDEA
jgi:hypothetical protein